MNLADHLLATPDPAWERFKVAAEPTATFRQADDNDLERLKARLLREVLAGNLSAGLLAPLRRAANEAAAIAWLEPHPLLVFPTLFEELAAAARRRAQRQQRLAARTGGWLEAA